MPKEGFRLCPHDQLPGKTMIEYWQGGKSIAGIYSHQDGLRVVSQYMTGVSEDHAFPPVVVIKLEVE